MTPSYTRDADEHGWVRRRMVAFVLDLLSREEHARCRTHLDACAHCREALEELRRAGPLGVLSDGHIPSDLIARWDRVGEAVDGLEREMIRRHLESCTQCRQDLEHLGFSPVLAERVAPAPGQVLGRVPRDRPRRIGTWALGVWAAAATVAVLWMVLGPKHAARDRGFMTAAPTLRLAATRGDSGPAVKISPDTPAIVLGLQDLENLPRSGTVLIELLSPTGVQVLEGTFPVTKVLPPHGLVVHAGDIPWESGVYVLRLTPLPTGGMAPGAIEYRLAVSAD